MKNARKYTKEVLAPVVAESLSVAEVLLKLGLKITGGSQTNIALYIRQYGLDTSHFLGKGSNRGKQHRGGPDKKSPEEILVKVERLRPETVHRLRRAMIEGGIPYECAGCGNVGEWRGKPLGLQIDHINGDRMDNRRENLRFLCPNCHAQTPNFGSLNKQR